MMLNYITSNVKWRLKYWRTEILDHLWGILIGCHVIACNALHPEVISFSDAQDDI